MLYLGAKKSLLSSGKTLAQQVAAMFAGGEQGAWYDPSDLSTLFQDSAGTTPVTAVGQPVGRMLDKSGRGNHVTQVTVPARPILQQDALGKYYFYHDGVDDAMSSAVSYTVGATHYLAAAIRRNNATASLLFGAVTSAVLYSQLVGVATGERINSGYRNPTGAFSVTSINATLGINHVFDGLALPGYLDSGVDGIVSSIVTSTTAEDSVPNAAIAIGSANVGMRFYGGIALVGNPGPVKRAVIRQYLAGKSGAAL